MEVSPLRNRIKEQQKRPQSFARDSRCEQVLVGDLVLVAVGDMVPADGFLIESLGLKVDEDL